MANVRDVSPEAMSIGMPVIAGFETFDDELTLPVFAPAPAAGTTEQTGET